MSKNILVEIDDEYVQSNSLSSNMGLVLRGPYEHVIKITDSYSTCTAVYDLLIAGLVHKKVPCDYCTKIRKRV